MHPSSPTVCHALFWAERLTVPLKAVNASYATMVGCHLKRTIVKEMREKRTDGNNQLLEHLECDVSVGTMSSQSSFVFFCFNFR